MPLLGQNQRDLPIAFTIITLLAVPAHSAAQEPHWAVCGFEAGFEIGTRVSRVVINPFPVHESKRNPDAVGAFEKAGGLNHIQPNGTVMSFTAFCEVLPDRAAAEARATAISQSQLEISADGTISGPKTRVPYNGVFRVSWQPPIEVTGLPPSGGISVSTVLPRRTTSGAIVVDAATAAARAQARAQMLSDVRQRAPAYKSAMPARVDNAASRMRMAERQRLDRAEQEEIARIPSGVGFDERMRQIGEIRRKYRAMSPYRCVREGCAGRATPQ